LNIAVCAGGRRFTSLDDMEGPIMHENMTTEQLLREAAYWRLFETPEEEALADSDDEEREDPWDEDDA